jgi:hypothetical protein
MRILGVAWLVLTAACSVSLISRKVAVFSPTAVTVAQQVSNAFETVERSYYDTQASSLVLNYDTQGFHLEAIKPFLAGEDLKVRQTLIQSLQIYAQTLADVAGNKPIETLEDQARSFGNSLSGLAQNDTLKKFAPAISDDKLNIATTAVATLGRWLIDRKRSKELPKIIADMSKPIAQIADLLIEDIGMAPDANGHGGRGLRNQLWIQYDKLLENQDGFILHNKNDMSVSERKQEIEKLPKLVIEQRDADRTLAATQDALRRMAAAHAAILVGDKSDASFQMRIAELIEEGKQVQSFYSSLGKK